jgi:hypothetical protein
MQSAAKAKLNTPVSMGTLDAQKISERLNIQSELIVLLAQKVDQQAQANQRLACEVGLLTQAIKSLVEKPPIQPMQHRQATERSAHRLPPVEPGDVGWSFDNPHWTLQESPQKASGGPALSPLSLPFRGLAEEATSDNLHHLEPLNLTDLREFNQDDHRLEENKDVFWEAGLSLQAKPANPARPAKPTKLTKLTQSLLPPKTSSKESSVKNVKADPSKETKTGGVKKCRKPQVRHVPALVHVLEAYATKNGLSQHGKDAKQLHATLKNIVDQLPAGQKMQTNIDKYPADYRLAFKRFSAKEEFEEFRELFLQHKNGTTGNDSARKRAQGEHASAPTAKRSKPAKPAKPAKPTSEKVEQSESEEESSEEESSEEESSEEEE